MALPTQDAWYEIVEGRTLEQGDILFQCPVFIPTPLTFPRNENQEVSLDEAFYDVVVMTQSCDLENNKISDVVLCAHWDLENAKQQDASLAKNNALAEIKGGRRPRYTLLNRCEIPTLPLKVRIVDCGKVFCLPLAFIQELAAQQGPRLRLRSPYREHLSQAFARFFMRVGLPQDIDLT